MFRAIAGGPSGRLSAAAYSLAAKRSPVATLSPLLRNPIIHHHHHNPLPLYATSSLSPLPPLPLTSCLSQFNSIPLGKILTPISGMARPVGSALLHSSVLWDLELAGRSPVSALLPLLAPLADSASSLHSKTTLVLFSFNSLSILPSVPLFLCSMWPLSWSPLFFLFPLLSPVFFQEEREEASEPISRLFFLSFFYFFTPLFFIFLLRWLTSLCQTGTMTLILVPLFLSPCRRVAQDPQTE